ncbi:MAG: ChrR family anti-sigma-E factor [Caulobacteraceae bacterium]
MTPRHHPDHALVIDFAAGTLGPGRNLVLSSHLGVCPACREEARLAESIGGALLGNLPPVAMQVDALARALARIERPPAAPAPDVPSPVDWIQTPPEVAAAARRRRWAAPGVWVAPVIRGPGAERTYLLRVAAGMAVPRHSHRGAELVCVLKGAYHDGARVHARGDFAENDEAIDHRPRATAESECICLIAADRPLVARDWVGKLFQPFVRI